MENNLSVGNNFIRNIIDEDIASSKHHTIVTRFPPEPNGYLHIGHAKAICLNFGLAQDYRGKCMLRMDDTNPEKESDEYVQSIKDSVQWLGFTWEGEVRYASDYFDQLYEYALELIRASKAYVCDLTIEEIRAYRGTLTAPGQDSPYRQRSTEQNLELFHRMKCGEFPDGSKTLRLKIDMSSANVNLRDPVIYRIRHTYHHRLGDKWCLYPLYDYTHCISDALEGVSHSLCTLEFESHRPLYDWVLDNISIANHPRQYEFSRLELSYTVTSKRKLQRLVTSGLVSGWDDPRLPTIDGMRRRGYSAAGIRLFIQRTGVSKSENLIDISVLEQAVRDTLEEEVPRVMAVMQPIKVILTNFSDRETVSRQASFHPHHSHWGERSIVLTRQIWIEASDFSQIPPAGWQRLAPGTEVRLRYSYIIRCDEVIKDEAGHIIELKCSIDHQTLGKNPTDRKVKGVIHWVSCEYAVAAEIRLYDRLFTVPRPDSVRGSDGEYVDFCQFLNPESLTTVNAWVEPAVWNTMPGTHYQFERLGYFVADAKDHQSGERMVFNRTVTLKDSWLK